MLTIPFKFQLPDGATRIVRRRLTDTEVIRVAQDLADRGMRPEFILRYFMSAGNEMKDVLQVLSSSKQLRVRASA